MSANNESGFNGVVSVSNRAGMSYWACQNMFVRMAGVNQESFKACSQEQIDAVLDNTTTSVVLKPELKKDGAC